MNKQKFVECLRSTDPLSSDQFDELKDLLVDYPYFSIGRTLIAKAGKGLNLGEKNALISTAAIYATDRKYLKAVIGGKPSPTKEDKAPKSSPQPQPKAEKETDITIPTKAPSADAVDQILDELEHDMEALRKSRMHFAEIQSQIDAEGSSIPDNRTKEKAKDTKDKNPEEETQKAPAPDDQSVTAEKEEKTETQAEKPKASDIVLDLEALKKEFEAEEKVDEPIDTDEFEEDEVEPEVKPPPRSNIVTNMSEAEENDEGEPGFFDDVEIPEEQPKEKKKKLPARADRDSRLKVKRADVDRLMKMKSIPNAGEKKNVKTEEEPEEKPKKTAAKKAPKKTEEAKTTATKKVATKTKKTDVTKSEEEKPKKKAKKKAETKKAATKKATTKKIDSAETKTALETKSEKATVSKSSSSRKKTAESQTETKQTTKKETESKSAPDKSESPGDDPVTRATRKALLDFGKAEGLSMSVSRASPSKRKRNRTSKSKDAGKASNKGGKDDDDSGGASSIIDKFLEENPSIKRKVLSGNKDDLSEESSKWDDDIASEYLAEIYVNQGNKARAIRIYENLSLKFPEKKSYFAALIEKLKS